MTLAMGFQWTDLYNTEKLALLHQAFMDHLRLDDPNLHGTLESVNPLTSEDLIPVALAIEQFIVTLFKLEGTIHPRYDQHHTFRLSSHFKRNFIQRDALRATRTLSLNGDTICQQLSAHLGQLIDPTDESKFASLGLAALSREDTTAINLFRQYSQWAHDTPEGNHRHRDGFLFHTPKPIDPHQRFPVVRDKGAITSAELTSRNGFNLTDYGISSAQAVDEAFYCIKCHERDKDSCRTGLKQSDGHLKTDALGQPLAGCPLDQKISEMNVLYEHGQLIAALAVVTLDNPMVALTGHRICSDCSRSCIFQKQDAVDIPSIETRLLKDVLGLPYGFEIYSLLTRWNPLNIANPYPTAATGRHVLVVGQGPSGIALSHLLLQQGHRVTAIDGLKIEPMPSNLKDTSHPIRDIHSYVEPLSERYAKGFGGVAEYGITVRWDKNFLFVVRLLLERQTNYTCLDGVRFGSSITIDNAFDTYGFDHVALCLGAGSPTLLPLGNITMPGVRLASDFLMALHLGDAAKLTSKTTLRLQLPAAVIGAGLTAVDTATEALAYYPIQVMHFYERYHELVRLMGQDTANALLQTDPETADTFLEHGRVLIQERNAASKENRAPNYLPFLMEWGGVHIYYRKRLKDAPSYRLNPNELKHALAEGVRFIELAEVLSLIPDASGRLIAMDVRIQDAIQQLPVRTLLIAAGTKPNTVLAQEFDQLQLDGDFFQPLHDHPFFVWGTQDNRYVSYLGDLHPDFSGSVVKALASAKHAAPLIHTALMAITPQSKTFTPDAFISTLSEIQQIDGNLHLKVLSLAAAQAYRPGQFYKLQPYGSDFTEATPLSPTHVDKDTGLIEFIVQPVGATTHALKQLSKESRIFLMGPTGSVLSVPPEHKIVFIVDPTSDIDTTAPLRSLIPNDHHQIRAPIDRILPDDFKSADTMFIAGSPDYIQQFKETFPNLNTPCYTFVYTHLQCMMKQVCAQCVYTVIDPETGYSSVQFGCAKHIEPLQKINYSSINKRNKNEALEETILDHWSRLSCNAPNS